MKIAFFSTHPYEKITFKKANKETNHEIVFLENRLTAETAEQALGFECICAHVNDQLNAATLRVLKNGGVKLLALRSAGFNHVDLSAAKELGLKVVRVPEYSPYAIAEHAVAMMLTLNRKTHKAYNKVRVGDFSIDNLVGFDLHGKTVGVIGTGKIGSALANIMSGFDCRVLLYDIKHDADLEKNPHCKYTELDFLFKESDIISLNVPLNPETNYLINEKTLSQMKKGVMLINTGRGGLIDTQALIKYLDSGHIGYAGLDVYEHEAEIFFQDHSEEIIKDEMLARLLIMPNVLITGHQAFLTNEALGNIADTTLMNVREFEFGQSLTNEVR